MDSGISAWTANHSHQMRSATNCIADLRNGKCRNYYLYRDIPVEQNTHLCHHEQSIQVELAYCAYRMVVRMPPNAHAYLYLHGWPCIQTNVVGTGLVPNSFVSVNHHTHRSIALPLTCFPLSPSRIYDGGQGQHIRYRLSINQPTSQLISLKLASPSSHHTFRLSFSHRHIQSPSFPSAQSTTNKTRLVVRGRQLLCITTTDYKGEHSLDWGKQLGSVLRSLWRTCALKIKFPLICLFGTASHVLKYMMTRWCCVSRWDFRIHMWCQELHQTISTRLSYWD